VGDLLMYLEVVKCTKRNGGCSDYDTDQLNNMPDEVILADLSHLFNTKAEQYGSLTDADYEQPATQEEVDIIVWGIDARDERGTGFEPYDSSDEEDD
jgi:hypothetical protein